MDRSSAAHTEFTDEGWWALRASDRRFGGKVYVDATGATTRDLIDLSVMSIKGPSSACALTKHEALALADELRRVAS